jgi:hypothetical protein
MNFQVVVLFLSIYITDAGQKSLIPASVSTESVRQGWNPDNQNGNAAHPINTGTGSFFPITSESQHLTGRSVNNRPASNGWQRYINYPNEVINDVDIQRNISSNSKELSRPRIFRRQLHHSSLSRQTQHDNRFVFRLCRLCVRFFLRLILP